MVAVSRDVVLQDIVVRAGGHGSTSWADEVESIPVMHGFVHELVGAVSSGLVVEFGGLDADLVVLDEDPGVVEMVLHWGESVSIQG